MFDVHLDDYLTAEHDRVGRLLSALANALRAQDLEDAQRVFFVISRALLRQIDAEERALFPVLERSDGGRRSDEARVTAIMRLEHVQLRSHVTAAGRALATCDLARAWDRFVELNDFLDLHNAKEEHVVGPAVDRALATSALRAALVGQMTVLTRDSSSR